MKWMVEQGGEPFTMPDMSEYKMTDENVKHQESQWYWYIVGGFGKRK